MGSSPAPVARAAMAAWQERRGSRATVRVGAGRFAELGMYVVRCTVCKRVGTPQEHQADAEAIRDEHNRQQGFTRTNRNG